MIQIDDKIVSLDVLQEYFACNLDRCKGICCVVGDSGAPLEEKEIKIIEKNFSLIEKFLPEKNKQYIREKGFYETDKEGDLVTVCIEGKECVFAFEQNGIYKCAIEKAYEEGLINFRKPISCHLFPIRVKKYDSFTAVNLIKADICKAAFIKGKLMKIRVIDFLKQAIKRKFGNKFFEKLDFAAKNLNIEKKI